ncbi:MAG: acetoin utilization protein AcuC [Chloroflexota bacterium]|nr:acetoin utilization protein AcuC [Chloroflexota bacterium]
MSGPLHVYYGPEVQHYYFGPGHPFNQRRVELFVELMRSLGLFQTNGNTLRSIRQATVEDARLFHTAEYLERLREASESGTGVLDQGDTPAFPGCLDASLWLVGSTLQALEAVMTEDCHAFSPGGGLHHGHPGAASGFCILDDAAIALAAARRRYGVTRAVYVDIDVHHGDGVFYGFYDDPYLLDIDLHQDGRTLFPGTGFVDEVGNGPAAGLKLNVPLGPGAADDSALLAWWGVAEPAIEVFRPQLIVMQCGADAHSHDPLAMLQWSSHTYLEVARSIHALAHEVCDGRLLLLGGGGYNPANVCVAWACIALTVGELPLSDVLPEAWRERFRETYSRPAPRTLHEQETYFPRAVHPTEEAIRELRKRSPLLRAAR